MTLVSASSHITKLPVTTPTDQPNHSNNSFTQTHDIHINEQINYGKLKTSLAHTHPSISMDVLIKVPSILTIAWFLLFFFTIIINHSFSARTLGHIPSPTHHRMIDHDHSMISFCMQDPFMTSADDEDDDDQTHQYSSSKQPTTAKVYGGDHQLPFPFHKPLGFFPPSGGIPLPDDPDPNHNPTIPAVPGIGVSFPAKATLEELELGSVTIIDETLYKSEFGSVIVGKAQGMYVGSSEDGSSHTMMMAMTASFGGNGSNDYEDGLRFFGLLHKKDDHESHVAVIGGNGKFQNANGYATVKTINISSSSTSASVQKQTTDAERAYKVLLFSVFLG